MDITKGNSNVINDNNNNNKNENNSGSDNKINSNASNNFEEDYDYEDNYDEVDNVEKAQEEVLETMFLDAKNSKGENKLSLYLDIISLDESKEKIWSYKCYQEICLIYLQFEDHYMFPMYYKELMRTARTLDDKKLRPYIENTVTLFLEEIRTHFQESISHWLEDLTYDFHLLEKDKVMNTFESQINLKILILSKGGNINNNLEKNYDEGEKNVSNFDFNNIIQYLNDKEKLEGLTNDYLIKECGCNPIYLDKKGNNFFYYQPDDSKRGGEYYEVPVGWIAFGLEVNNRYGNDNDWLSNDGRYGEWAVAYHGFGCRMSGNQIKGIIKTIVHDNLKPGVGQSFAHARDSRHPGKLCNTGVYITPTLNVATQYAGVIPLGGKNYRLVIMVRVNPSFIREPETHKGYWIVDGNSNQLRPYRLLIREDNFVGRMY
jgi:hypothetical protein